MSCLIPVCLRSGLEPGVGGLVRELAAMGILIYGIRAASEDICADSLRNDRERPQARPVGGEFRGQSRHEVRTVRSLIKRAADCTDIVLVVACRVKEEVDDEPETTLRWGGTSSTQQDDEEVSEALTHVVTDGVKATDSCCERETTETGEGTSKGIGGAVWLDGWVAPSTAA